MYYQQGKIAKSCFPRPSIPNLLGLNQLCCIFWRLILETIYSQAFWIAFVWCFGLAYPHLAQVRTKGIILSFHSVPGDHCVVFGVIFTPHTSNGTRIAYAFFSCGPVDYSQSSCSG
jgi:hypothetical protein